MVCSQALPTATAALRVFYGHEVLYAVRSDLTQPQILYGNGFQPQHRHETASWPCSGATRSRCDTVPSKCLTACSLTGKLFGRLP